MHQIVMEKRDRNKKNISMISKFLCNVDVIWKKFNFLREHIEQIFTELEKVTLQAKIEGGLKNGFLTETHVARQSKEEQSASSDTKTHYDSWFFGGIHH